MNLEFLWGAFCQKAIIDKNDSTLSLITILNKIEASITINSSEKSIPSENIAIPLSFSCVLFFKRDDKDINLLQTKSIEVITEDPSGKEVLKTDLDIIFNPQISNTNTIINYSVTANKSGKYLFKIFSDNKKNKIGEIELSINLNIIKNNE